MPPSHRRVHQRGSRQSPIRGDRRRRALTGPARRPRSSSAHRRRSRNGKREELRCSTAAACAWRSAPPQVLVPAPSTRFRAPSRATCPATHSDPRGVGHRIAGIGHEAGAARARCGGRCRFLASPGAEGPGHSGHHGRSNSSRTPSPPIPKNSDASYWLCARQRNSMLAAVEAPSVAYGSTW